MEFKKYDKIKIIGDEENKDIFKNKSDEIILQEKLDGCFYYNTKILLEDFSKMEIGKIVNKKLPIKVMSYNPITKNIEPKQIINWYKNGKTDKWITIVLKGRCTSRKKKLITTPNHYIYSKKGMIQAKNLKIGDKLYTPKYNLNELQKQLLIGSLLGDGCLIPATKNRYYKETHSMKQKAYSLFKINILKKTFNIKTRNITTQCGAEGFNFSTNCDERFNEIINLCYPTGEKTINQNWLNDLSLFGICIWFLDDGSVNFNNRQRPRAQFHTEGFSYPEQILIRNFLMKRGYNCKIHKSRKYYYLVLDANSTERFLFDIAPFVPKCMDYKLPANLKNNKYIENIKVENNGLYESEILNILPNKKDCYYNDQKYDIEVEDNHNYFANYTLVSNSNSRFYITKKKQIIFGSRTQQLTSDKGEDTNVEKNFRRFVNYVRERWDDVKDISPDLSGYVLYGENMVSHTMQYDWEKIPPFLGFDIYNMKTGKYLNYKDVKKIFKNLKLEMVPILKICKAKDIKPMTDEDIPISKYASMSSKDQQAEGVIYKNYNRQVMCKIVRQKFKEKNKEVFGGSKKFAKTDDEYFTAVYCTNARIDKCIFKLIDEGKELSMTMMGDLLNMVYKDIWEENWNEIAFSKKKIDLLNLKRLMSKRCLEVLKQSMFNNALSQKEGIKNA